MENTSTNTKPVSKLKIGGEVKHVDQQFLQDNLDRFSQKYGNETVYVTNPDGQKGYIPISQLRTALDEGYTLFDDAANIQVPTPQNQESPKPQEQSKPQEPHIPTPGEAAVARTIGANTRNQIGHTFSTLNQEARNTMQEVEEATANLPQVPRLPEQTDLEYAEAVAAASDKVMEQELEKQQKQMQDLALPTTRAEIDKQLDEINGELATLGQQRYGKLDANPAYGNPMLMGIDMNAHRRAKLYAENKERIDELERQRAALEAQKSMLRSIEKYQEYDRKGDKSGISNFFRAIKVGGDLQSLASFGLTKMQEDLSFAQILERAHKGETLTLDEKKAIQMYNNIREIAAMDRGSHFNAGLGMQQTFEFMRDIFLAGMTGGAPAGNLIAQYGVKGAVKQLGKNTAKKAAEVYLKTALTPSFYKNLTSEIVDNYDLKYYGDDTYGADKKRSGLSLLYRTWAETGAEYFTESLSGLIGNIGIAKRIAQTARGKGMLSKALRTFDEIHDRTKQNPIGGKILEGLSKIGVGNIPEELLEEMAVVPLQSLTLGENRMGQLLDPRFYQEVLISTAAIGGMNSATNILVGGTTAAIEKRKTNNKIKDITASLTESLKGSNEAVQSAYDRFISNLENENFYDEEGVFAPESILDDLQALRDATNNDDGVMSQAEELAKYHIFKQGQTEALRVIAEEELGPIEYGNSASVVPFLDMTDGKTYHKLGETKDVVILGTNDKSIPGGKIVVPRSSLNGKELDPIPISEYVTDYFISKPAPTKVETLDDISEIRQQGTTTSEPVISPVEPAPSADGVQHFGGVATSSNGNAINVGDTAAYGESVVKVVDIYEGDDKKLEVAIEDENGEQHIVSFNDLAPVVHQDNSTKTRYILPDGRRAVVQSSNGDNVTLGVLDDNNQVVEEIPSTMEEVLTLDKVQSEEAEVIETAAAEMAAGGTETAPSGTDDLPRDKEGNIDYDALLAQSPTRFVEQMRSDFGTEVADVQLGKMVGNIDDKITELSEKVDKETSPNKVASMLREIKTLQGQRDAISTALTPAQQPVTTQESVPAAPAQAPEQIAPDANNIAPDATSAPNEEIKPVGVGPFGEIYNQFKGKAKEAIAFLKSKKDEIAIAALRHNDVGDIDLAWGIEDTEVDNLQEIVDNMRVVSRSGNRIKLESDTHQAALSLNSEDGNWLLTAFKKKNSVPNNRMDTDETSSGSKENDTATLQDTVSENKDTTISETSSGVEEKNLTKPNDNQTETKEKPNKTILEKAQDTVESTKVDAAAKEANTEPTEAQKEAGNYKKGHTIIQGLNISIEQPKGSTRSGKDPNGKKWSVKMNNHYGYIRGTQGKDKDHIDVFIGDSPTSKKVYVVDQMGSDGLFDEHKVMIGFDSLEEAKAAYLSNYEEGWQGLGEITETSMDGFKEWIGDGTPKTRRFAEYAKGIPESYMKRAAQWQKKLGIGITVYNSIDDIKDKSVQEQLRAGIGVSGWISRDDNGGLKEIGIYLPYINSKADVDKTAIHEIVAHYGLKGLLGEDKYNELCDNVWVLMRPYEQDQYLRYPGVNNDTRKAADEYIAHLAETLDPDTLSRSDKSIWKKIVEAVKNFFAPHKKKTDVDLTDAISEADLSTLLRASYARLASESGKKTQSKKPSKFKLEDAVLKEKNSTRPALTGIYHDSGYKVASDTNVLVALKEDYPMSAEGKVFVKGKPIAQSNYPKWQILFNDKFEKSNIPVDFDKLIEKLSTIKKNEGKMPYYISLKANDGQVYYYHPDRLMIFAKAAKEIGGELMMQRINQGLSSESAKLIITSPRGKAIIIPMSKIGDSANIYDISFVDESTPVAQFVEKYETKENQTETKPKPKKTKEKPTTSKEVSSTPSKGKVQDQKIEDFGEKIGGARKDVARQRVRDAVNLTKTDLQKLADPDKILSRANIIKSLREGTMTKEDAITLMAMNNTVRCADSTEKYIMMPKYRDMALAWANGQSPIFHITDKDIEDRFEQIGEHIKARMSDAQVEKHKQNIKEYYDILYEYYSDYIKTYRDLDYPNVERKLAGAIIRKFSHSDSFWVLKKADARRGRTFRIMIEAIAYMKREYPVVVAKAKEDKTSADDSQKVGHLRVVKDSTGWFRIKSSEIPGEIYFSKSFSSRTGAEEYLQENRDMLIAKEQRAIDALMGSNIGMAERQGPDYRNGKDITSDEYLKAFGFRGVEFGNWVTQAERQMYLNKSYDAIMDICSILGISPKAFSLGGKLAIAFGARGHSKAMAHYESSKQVINLTRMKGVGSFAHEWFHAIDNYLARENSGNTTEFVTEKHPTKRQELYDAFNEFVSKMNTLDYTRRSRRAGDYWGSVIERAARMFESYIYTELGAKDISSPLLVDSHSVLSDEYLVDSDISSYPIPTAEETRQIKPYLDKIFSTIQEEVDADDNHILFRVAENVGSFEDAIKTAKDKGYENLSAYPDVTNQILEDALTSGRIMVYSKDPIAGGTTVSPSVQRASELSGPDAQIYSKDISIDQVAWETPDEGTYTTNDDIRFRFIGEQGAANLDRAEEATIRMDNLAVAREMETAGKDAKTIKIATGWERGADKMWRYEVEDNIDFDSPVDRLEILKEEYASVVRDKDKIIRLLNMYPTKGRTEQQKEQIKQLDKKHKSLIAKTDALLNTIHEAERELSGMSLEELIGEDNNLFKEYPQLADTNVSFIRNSRFGNYKGFYSPSENTIWISPDNGQPASTLVHELQHAIQHIEGFARGGNTSTGNELRDKAKAWSWKKQLEQTEKEHPELAGSIRLQASLEDEYKADGMEEKMPSKEIRTTGFNLYVRGYDNEGYESAYDQWEKIGLIDNPKDYSTYKRLAGEVEARNVQARKWMPASVRRETLAVDTEYNDVARKDQIFIMDGIAAQNDVRFRAKGLESLVERTYRKDGSFSFSGKNKIESADDVAFIFKQLEDSAIENAFLVFVKDGKPTILHVGMGDISKSIVDSSVVLPAYKDFGADKVYMVHNHPSGNLVASKPDIDMLLLLKAQLPKASVEGIIINTLSGNYAVINDGEIKPILETQDTVELEMLSFSKNVFSPEYKSTMAERKISGPESIAAYLSAHRLGSGSKVGALLLNRSNVINGNLVTNSNEVSTENAQELAREIAEAANRCSANAVVLFGDFDYSDKAIAKLQRQIPIVSGMSVTMLDVVRLNGKHTQSLHDMTLPSRSTLSDGVRFRISDQNTLRDNLQAAITGYIVGTNTTGDVITTDDMVNTIYDYVENAGESSLKYNLVKELDAYEQNVRSGELNDSIISAEELLIENVHDIINMYSDDVMFRADLDPLVQNEIQSIVDAAKANGTYMKAPNGKQSNLTPEQWAMVRTENFKNWFGDWEKAARIKKLRNSENAALVGNEIDLSSEDIKVNKINAIIYGKNLRRDYTNKDTGRKILLTSSKKNGGLYEILEHDYKDREHLLSIAAIPQIIEKSIYIDTIENEDLEKYPHILSYDYYFCGLNIGDEEYTVKAVISNLDDGSRYYDHKLTAIEKGRLIDIINKTPKSSVSISTQTPDIGALSGIKDKRLISILQTNVSKVVDENGEPRVVYHGTSNVFNTFEMHDGSLGKGAYFSSNWDEAAEYSLEKLGFSKDEYDELPYDEAIVVEAFLNVRDEHNITHSRFSREDIEVLATSPNQIKSATDNIGTFDPANPDIRFRAVPTTTAEDIDKNGFHSYLSEKDYDRMKKEILKGAPILRMSLYTPDEYISSVIDKLTQQSPSDATEALQMASSVRDAFTRAGIVLDMSDNEIIYALWKEVNPSDAVTIKEKLEHNHKSNDVRYRIDSTIGPNTNDIKLTRGEQFRENWVDKMVTVKMFQDLVKKRGGSVEDNLNPYITENLSLGRQQRENELFQENIYRPMVEQVTAIEKLFVKEGLASKEDAYKAVNDFLYARHAPERNRHVVIGEIEDYITRAITPAEMKFISGDNPRAEIRALATRIYNIYANGVADTSEVFAKNMLNTRYKSKDLNERLKEFRNKFLGTVKGAKEYTEKVFNSKRGTNRSGMSDKEAKEILDKYYVKSTQAELDKLSDLVRESTHFTLDTWYKYNMISAKERDNYKSMYKYYIPLRNWEVSEDIDYSELTNQAFNHASEIISTNKKAHGRSSRADNPLAYIASLAQSAIVLGNKNQVRLNMYRLVLKNLNILGDIATIPKVYFVKNNATGEITQTTERPAQELFDQGLVETKTNKDYRWHKTGAEYQAHLIPVIINGDRHLIEMRGEFGVKIASAINNTNSVHLSYLDATRPVTQWLSATRTSYNPEFIPTNFARDFMFGNMAYAIEGGNIIELNKNLGRAFRAINRSELGTKNKDQYDRYYEEFMNEGAQTGFMNMRNIETMKKDLEKMHKQMLRTGGKASDMKNFAIKYGSAGIQYLNAMSENAMRFAVYLTEREKGTSAKQAAFAAKEITVNFNRKGRYTENMGALYSFFNASVQGTARLYDLTKKHRKRTAVALAALTTIKLASDLICVLFAGDDYDELSDYVKFSNILIPIGEQEDGRMKFLKIPMAQGVRAVTNIADVTVDVLRGTKTVAEAAKTFFLNNLGEHLPLSFEAIDLTGRDNMASFVTPFLPSVAVPFFEAWRNTDFKGDPIYRDDFTLASKEYQPRYTRAYGSTNPAYVALSRGLNALAGGNDELTSAIKVDENGNISRRWYGYAFDINPAIVEHIIDGFMGGITTFPSNTIKTISSAISDEKEVELYNVPILNRFVSVPTYKEGYDLYYRTSDLVRDIQASEKAVKAVGDMDAYRAIKNNRFNATIKNAYLEYNDRVKYLKELMGNPDLSTQQMKDIETRMDEVMKDASAAFEEIYNKYDNNIERYEED